jgi:hypothetical protein
MDIDPSSGRLDWNAGRVDGRWTPLPPGTTAAVRVEAWLQGPSDDVPADPAVGDPALARQLKNLGYLN